MSGIRDQRSGATGSLLPSASRWSWITPVLLVVIGTVLGFIVGRFGPPALALEYTAKWDIVDVLTALFTISIALYLQHAVASGSEASRERRRYLAEMTRRVSSDWEVLQSVLRDDGADVFSVAAAVRTVDISVIELRDAISICRVSASCAELEIEWLRYRGLLDDFPEPLDSTRRARLQQHFVDGRKCANRLVLALPTS